MIKTDAQYEDTRARLAEERARLSQLADVLEGKGLTEVERAQLMGPGQGTIAELEAELREYEALKEGHIRGGGLQDLGRLLISLRIAKGITQADLARQLGVHPSQISRDERNEYRAASLNRIRALLEALDATDQLRLTYQPGDSSAA